MKMNFHSLQIRRTFTRNVLHLVSTISFNCFEGEVLGTRKGSIPQLNRGLEMICVMQRYTDHFDVSRVLII